MRGKEEGEGGEVCRGMAFTCYMHPYGHACGLSFKLYSP